MTQKFHEGQDVEVLSRPELCISFKSRWRKGKIAEHAAAIGQVSGAYVVQFHDGSHGVFDAEHIRTVEPSVMEHMEKAHKAWPPEQFD
jgi:hypothetical protein